MKLDTTDLCVVYTVNCAELGELPAGLTLDESPPIREREVVGTEEEPATLLTDFSEVRP